MKTRVARFAGVSAVAFLAAGCGPAAASTGVPAKQFQEFHRTSKDVAEFSLSLIEDGFGWANAELMSRGQPKLYCGPGKPALTNQQLGEIFEALLSREPERGKYPVGLVLLKALQERFPCGSNPAAGSASKKAPRPADRQKWR